MIKKIKKAYLKNLNEKTKVKVLKNADRIKKLILLQDDAGRDAMMEKSAMKREDV